jgi:hypothetical protein
MYDREKSDPAIVAVKLTNKAGQPAAESVEPRAGAEGNVSQQSTGRAQYRETVSQALKRIRGDFILLSCLVHEDCAIVEFGVDMNARVCALPSPIPRGETRAAFPAEPTPVGVRAGSACQRSAGWPPRRGCLDGRVIRRARI